MTSILEAFLTETSEHEFSKKRFHDKKHGIEYSAVLRKGMWHACRIDTDTGEMLDMLGKGWKTEADALKAAKNEFDMDARLSESDEHDFKIGDTVGGYIRKNVYSGTYHGSSQYVEGKITHDHGDGTVTIKHPTKRKSFRVHKTGVKLIYKGTT